jgi:hypothetical protein
MQDPDPNPETLVRGMDPRIQIHTKMSWIRNTGTHSMAYPQHSGHNLILPRLVLVLHDWAH